MNITIDILPTAQSAAGRDWSATGVVVVDVLRATTVISQALASGADSVAAVASVDEALALRAADPTCILGGERNADRIEGFDLGNSPQDYTPERVGGRTVVLTTTNGTLALANCRGAASLSAGSLLNATAVATGMAMTCALRDLWLTIVCAGNGGLYTIEDCLCAAKMAQAVERVATVTYASDFALGTRMMADSPDAMRWVRQGVHCQRLEAKGYGADIAACLDMADSLGCVPTVGTDGHLRAL